MTHRRMILLAALWLTACDGNTNTPATGQASAPASAAPEDAPDPAARHAAGGLWIGRYHARRGAGDVVGLVTEQGEARFVSSGAQIAGTLEVDGDRVRGTLQSFAGNRAAGTMTLDAQLSPRRTLSGSFTSIGDGGRFELTYSDAYERRVSLAALADAWGSSGFAMTAEQDGRFEGKDRLGCRYQGTLAQVDPRFNAFRLRFEVSGCAYQGSYTGLSALTPREGGIEWMAYGASGASVGVAGFLARGKNLGYDASWRVAVDEANEAAGEAKRAAGEAKRAADEARRVLKGLR